MSGLLANVDPDGLLEYSVVFTDRSLNHMSARFQQVMRDISTTLKEVYSADHVVIVPGGGTYGMEAVARQFGHDQHCMVIRNGFFSYRWSQIFAAGKIPAKETVLKAGRIGNESQSPWAPAAIDEVVATILSEKPDMVFAPHVETASGMLLPDDYIKAVTDAVHEVGGLFVLDCVASGTLWADMKKLGVDILISAPQKGWSASPCAALVMMNDAAEARMNERESSSFALNLKTWSGIMKAYENGGHAYHATMPTDALAAFRDTMLETRDYGFDKVRDEQIALGNSVRTLLESRGIKSVAAPGFQAPGVVVSYTTDPGIQNGSKFVQHGMQAASGVPLMCDEPADYMSFRLGLFGLDKLHDCEAATQRLAAILDQLD
ncbi:MAG: aminotransferase [Oceanospirillaceae bacterium]|uniref:aminotransferase class V-fold PLP-dependent enzyme n=1 Tax=Thalassolituus sp. UBA1505 TaxID=1947653 RepID=UPI000C0B4CDC|nr:aminotransferase class V-fold PLP-dependent enzyme [Thalassolituus sp. UBA1505]MAK91971.1 aminotransferase [Thalassolituus sp.]MAS24069.1 aminotransferase [Oceanospirillaceae bacterium]MAX98727.1 aminotransferase [Oceanospirillaceae bacterium]MBL33575.1 aminotransferase [Oceanospirillaceae bacterium]MBS53130.1 aminotransferase [Oceanospirillaceae bacterium]|tara:strand:- start:474 stop:1601 length:1128 start_codon:yes stop_codon:yes gene_type:complete